MTSIPSQTTPSQQQQAQMQQIQQLQQTAATYTGLCVEDEAALDRLYEAVYGRRPEAGDAPWKP